MTKEINANDLSEENSLNLQRSSSIINQQIESFSSQLIEPVKSLGLPRKHLILFFFDNIT